MYVIKLSLGVDIAPLTCHEYSTVEHIKIIRNKVPKFSKTPKHFVSWIWMAWPLTATPSRTIHTKKLVGSRRTTVVTGTSKRRTIGRESSNKRCVALEAIDLDDSVGFVWWRPRQPHCRRVDRLVHGRRLLAGRCRHIRSQYTRCIKTIHHCRRSPLLNSFNICGDTVRIA